VTNPNRPRYRCQKLDPALFFSYAAADMAKAKQACHGITEAGQELCPIIFACRDYARANGEWGIWGGEDERERAAAGYAPRFKRQDELEDGGAIVLDLENRPVQPAKPRLRRPRHRVQRANVQPCGTMAAVHRHKYAGEPLCPPCREAIRVDRESKRRAKGIQAKKPAECGTRSGCQKHRTLKEPPCEPCLEAERAYNRKRRRKPRPKKTAPAG
jgi:hypothetical protein